MSPEPRQSEPVAKAEQAYQEAGGSLPPGLPIDTPDWVMPVIRRGVWRLVLTVLLVVAVIAVASRARSVIMILAVALFFGIAMEPAVNGLQRRFGIRRGLGTAMVFLVLLLFVGGLLAIVVPGLIDVADQLRLALESMVRGINERFGTQIPTSESDPRWLQLTEHVRTWVESHATRVAGVAESVVGVVFQFATIAMFAFYFAMDAPRVRRAVLSMLPSPHQERLGWSWDKAVEETGGYFYSRLILMGVNGGLFLVGMLIVGVPWALAIPLAIFEGFLAEFIPVVGTYIGAAVPLLVVLGLKGLVPAAILLGWAVVYQQLENYFLSPKISARTMQINGGVAFGAAITGGLLIGPIGAVVALPVAALITAFIRNYARRYPVVYVSPYDAEPAPRPHRRRWGRHKAAE